jgi:hypoxanthine-DNA glycosylase
MKLLRVAKIALWDIVKNCDRVNSADTNLKNMQPNDIAELLIRYPNIKKIFFTGRTAEKLYKKHFYKLLLPSMLLPSPSPAYAAVKFEQKLRIWREALL